MAADERDRPPPRDDTHPEGPDAGQDSWGSRRALEVLGMAFVFPAAIVVGYLAGRWIGAHAGAATAGAVLGATLGAVAGFWQLFAFLRRLRQ
jgi:hypothetical protein